uniref:Urocanate hydratase 1 n=1 Tax=Cebus imitator TaxID=2715852 RepID=A0A2K5S0Y3_CEBIM
MSSLQALCSGLPLRPLPKNRGRQAGVPHAPVRTPGLSPAEKQLALRNALRYFPQDVQNMLAPEFAQELQLYGHIYMYRFCPDIEMRAYPVEQYPCRTKAAAAIMHMIMNNLDPAVAQFPQELVTYGGNGQVFSNWAQFWLTMFYLSKMTEEQTLVMYSGHPLGLFPSSRSAPRLIITNGMVATATLVPRESSTGVEGAGWEWAASPHLFSLQLTMLNAARRYLGIEDLAGKVFVTSGLGGMSGAQAKAAVIVGCIGVIAEVDKAALEKRHKQGWLMEVTDSLDQCIKRLRYSSKLDSRHLTHGSGKPQEDPWGATGLPAALGLCVLPYFVNLSSLGERKCLASSGLSRGPPVLLLCPSREARKKKKVLSLGYHGNVVALWERLVHELDTTGECLVDLGSDQTSCHNPFNGGYYPVQLSFTEAQSLMASNPAVFKDLVQESLRRQVSAINRLAEKNFFFWDYGNAFLLEAQRAGADVEKKGACRMEFRYPSYVQHIMGDIFSQGFGPFRWVCTSGDPQDLAVTDELATSVLEEAIADGVKASVKLQYMDNIRWIREAARHRLVVGSQARILYSDQKGRVAIAVAINQAIAGGRIKAPVVLSRDHHDVSGTDSPFRETSNIYDGSAFCADMAVQNFVGDACRGATWVALHNGGGVGWGEVINGGFGLVLDGTPAAEQRARLMLSWDVSNGVARRCWSGNRKAYEIICQTMQENSGLVVTLPHDVGDEQVLQQALQL